MDRARQFFRKLGQTGEALRKLPPQLLVAFKQRLLWIPPQAPSSIRTLARLLRTDPVVDRGRNQSHGLGRLRLLPDDQQHLRVTALLWRGESLDRGECNFIKVELVFQHAHVSWLLADQLRISVLHDARAVGTRLYRGSNEVFECLRNAPNAGVQFARGPK